MTLNSAIFRWTAYPWSGVGCSALYYNSSKCRAPTRGWPHHATHPLGERSLVWPVLVQTSGRDTTCLKLTHMLDRSYIKMTDLLTESQVKLKSENFLFEKH